MGSESHPSAGNVRVRVLAKKTTSKKTSSGRAKKAAPTGVKKKAAKKAIKKTVKKVAKKASRKTVKKVAKKASRKTVKKVAKKASGKTVKKVAKKAPRKTVKKVAEKAAPPADKAIKTAKKPKMSLTRRQMRPYRVMLLDKRRALVGDLNGIQAEAFGGGRQNGAGELSNMPTHPADVGTDNYEQEFSLGLLESERILLAEIDDALLRIQKGTYGTCLGTGDGIGKARLTAKPWAKYGIEYARMVEKGLVRPGEDDLISDDED
jgi:DnaK suppressor protein